MSHAGGCPSETHLCRVPGACAAAPRGRTGAASVTLSNSKMTHGIMCKDHDWFCSPAAEGTKGNVPLWTELGRKGKQLVGRGVDARALILPAWTLEPLQNINRGKCVCFSHCVRVRKP